MVAKRPVIVYGANGYTGRLICEFLRDYRVPFVAAGRNETKLKDTMATVPGIETADYEIATVDHSIGALTTLFEGATVICNAVGPFELYGETVVEAALKAGVHYLDTTGEQHYMIPVRDKFGAQFRKAGLVLCPSLAYMYAAVEIAVAKAAAHPGVTTIHAHVAATGTPTYASTQTVVRAARAAEFYLKDRKLAAWPRGQKYEVMLPLWGQPQLSLPWSGTCLPVWYEGHASIENLKALVCFADNRELMEQVYSLIGMFDDQLADKSYEEQEAALTQLAEQIQSGTPPRENRQTFRNLDRAIGFGPATHVEYNLHSTCSYQQTGLFQAFGASRLVAGAVEKSGFLSPVDAFGADNLLAALRMYGYGELVKTV